LARTRCSPTPIAGAGSVPRDGSIIVNFNEAVTADPGFFDIACVTTGAHNDATVASIFDGTGLVIIPNVNFLAGEQCTDQLVPQCVQRHAGMLALHGAARQLVQRCGGFEHIGHLADPQRRGHRQAARRVGRRRAAWREPHQHPRW
jgi:hypothetical protein